MKQTGGKLDKSDHETKDFAGAHVMKHAKKEPSRVWNCILDFK